MTTGLLRKQTNYAMGMAVLLLLGVAFFYGLFSRDLFWFQAIMLIFTIYAVVMLVAPLLRKKIPVPRNDFYRPFVSILVPARNEEAVIGSTIQSLSRLSYYRNGKPNFEIIVVDDGSTDQTGKILEEYRRKFEFVRVVSRPPGIGSGKSAALNSAIPYCHGEVIGVFDADTRVDPDFLLKSLPLLHPSNVGGVQGRVKIYNPNENLITRLQNDEFLVFNHLTLVGKDMMKGVTCLGGNGQLVKKEALLEAGGWNEESVTEDFDLTFRLLLNGLEVKYAEHAILRQEAVPTWQLLLRQRIRWGQGLLTSFFDFFLPVFSARITPAQRLDGVITLSRILLPFWVIEGYFYELFPGMRAAALHPAFTPLALTIVTLFFFVSMGAALLQESPCSWPEMSKRVVLYWFYSLLWVVVLPISYFNYFKTYRSFFWDKTSHSGLKDEAYDETASASS